MLTLKRSIRLKDQILLPNGDRVNVDLDVEAHQMQLNKAWNDVILAAQDWMKDIRNAENEALRRNFYAKYEALLRIVLGKGGLQRALAAYDGNIAELCTMLDSWVGTDVQQKIHEASAKLVERRKASARKQLRRRK